MPVYSEEPDSYSNAQTLAHGQRLLQQEVLSLREALMRDPAKWSFRTLLLVADRILAENYGEAVFPRSDSDEGDAGPVFLRRLRDALDRCRGASWSSGAEDGSVCSCRKPGVLHSVVMNGVTESCMLCGREITRADPLPLSDRWVFRRDS